MKQTTAATPKGQASGLSRWWMSWLLGIGFLAGVIVVAIHVPEEVAFFQVARKIGLSWLGAALILQAGTYVAQGEIWRTIGKTAGMPLPRPLLYRLSLAKLFMDNAIPSAGMSGTVVVAKSLEGRGLPRSAVVAGIVVNTTSFFIAYVAALAAALAIVVRTGHSTPLIVSASVLFMLLGAALTAGMLALTGRQISRVPQWLGRFHIVQNALTDANDADAKLVRNVRVQAAASIYQLLTFLLDAATLWILLRSLGAKASLIGVFSSFMIANLFRTVSFIPGGLGTFEAAVVYMLKRDRVSVTVGLAAALLFRGITFFLPMAPGMWYSHRLNKPRDKR